MLRIYSFYIALLLVACSACSSRIDPLAIPSPNVVTSIEGTISNSYDFDTKKYRDAVTITDLSQINHVIAFVSALNHNMEVPDGTFPTPTHTLVVNDNAGVNLVVFIGLDWV